MKSNLRLLVILVHVSYLDLKPYYNDGYGYSSTKCNITLKGLNKEFRKPGKYQVQVSAKAKDLAFSGTAFNVITAETLNCGTGSASYNEVVKRLSPSGSLVLDVTITLKLFKTTSTSNILHNPMIMYKKIVLNNLALLDEPQFSDFKFIVKGKEFKVHRAVLAAASPVFTKLFTADMEEARSGECIVENIEPEIFEHLLRFIYGGKLPEDIGAVSMKLFEAAHYYDITQLKEICKEQLPPMLKTENAMELFNWAHVYDEIDLKLAAWEIIKR
jgi:BTB/POZ domain